MVDPKVISSTEGVQDSTLMLRLLDSDKHSETLYLELTGTTDETLDVLDPLSYEVCRRIKVAIANVMTSSGRGRRSGHNPPFWPPAR